MRAPEPSPARSYVSPARQEAMAHTRRRILDAAARMFDTRGYRATTMAAIASEAGVSVQRVALAGTKSSLLLASFEQAFAGDEGRHPLSERPAVQDIMRLPPEAALRAYTGFLAAANARSAGIWLAMRAAAQTDADVAAVVADMEVRRHNDLLGAVHWAASQDLLEGDTSADMRAQILAEVVSAESYRYYIDECRWNTSQYERWMGAAIGRLVFGGI